MKSPVGFRRGLSYVNLYAMNSEHEVQVGKGYYNRRAYNTLERFISYHYQVDSIAGLDGVTSVLEIGAGTAITAKYLSESGIKVTTCDFDANTSPDIVADIRNIPVPAKSHDAVVAFQVLEHIPFEDFGKALAEFARISKKNVIISLPYRSSYFEFVLKFPGIRTLFKKNFFDLSVRFPLVFGGFETSGQHYWEIDRKHYSLKRVRKVIEQHFMIEKEFSPVLNKFHYFFILKVK